MMQYKLYYVKTYMVQVFYNESCLMAELKFI